MTSYALIKKMSFLKEFVPGVPLQREQDAHSLSAADTVIYGAVQPYCIVHLYWEKREVDTKTDKVFIHVDA
jgi:hypothetical protein